MGVALAAVGAGISLASAVAGAVGSARKNKQANQAIEAQRAENERWYNMKQNEDYMQRADVQAVLKKQKEMLEDQYKTARATNVVAGGTDESLAKMQQQANQSVSDTMTNIAAQSSQVKDAAENSYRSQDAALNQQQVGVYQNAASNIATAASQGVSAGVNLIGAGIKSMETPTATPSSSSTSSEK